MTKIDKIFRGRAQRSRREKYIFFHYRRKKTTQKRKDKAKNPVRDTQNRS